jgi:hypothetical protein
MHICADEVNAAIAVLQSVPLALPAVWHRLKLTVLWIRRLVGRT